MKSAQKQFSVIDVSLKKGISYQFFLAALLMLLAGGAPTLADEWRLYAVTFTDRQLLVVDTNTGAGTVVTNFTLKSMDLATYRGGLYLLSDWAGASKLSQINPETGETLQTLTFTNDLVGGEGAFDFQEDGTLIGSRSSSVTGTLYRASSTNLTLITVEGGLSPSLDGLAFDQDGTLFGLSQNRGGHHSLYVVSPDSGQTALIGDLGVNFAPNGLVVAGLAFAPDGTLFAALGGATESMLYRVDKTTGTATAVGAIGYPGVSGIRFYRRPPGPLAVQAAGAQMRLSWPHTRGGDLETCDQLGRNWAAANLAVTTNGPEAVVWTLIEAGQSWFRLRQQP